MHPEKLLAGVAMAAMLACFAIAVVGRILGEKKNNETVVNDQIILVLTNSCMCVCACRQIKVGMTQRHHGASSAKP